MVLDMKVITSMVKNMVQGNSTGLMDLHTSGSSSRTISKEEDATIGRMEGNITVNGKTIKWKDMVFSHGRMEGNMKETIRMIRNMDMVSSNGLIVNNKTYYLKLIDNFFLNVSLI